MWTWCILHDGETNRQDAGLSYTQLRIIKQYLKPCGLSFPEEKHQRTITNELTKVTTTVTNTAFITKSGYQIEVQLGTLKDVKSYIITQLNELTKYGKLTTHNNTIPDIEIWIKLGGHPGKGSMKLALQIANTLKPNLKDKADIKNAYQFEHYIFFFERTVTRSRQFSLGG